jgi:hypothetical protein
MSRGTMNRPRLTVRTILLVACLLPIACVGPVEENTYYSEMESVWQYLKAYSIYHERLQGDAFAYSTINEMFDALGDTLYGVTYTDTLSHLAYMPVNWQPSVKMAGAAAADGKGENRIAAYLPEVFLDTLTIATVRIKIEKFDLGITYNDLLNVLPGIRSFPNVIVDLRGNGGGDIDEMDSIINRFLPAGKAFILARERKYNESSRTAETLEWHEWATDTSASFELEGKKVVVLIDQNSASASEILVAALKEVVGATIVGSRSYGKGIGQIKIVRRNRNALQITYLQLRGISDGIGNYHHKGIEPDVKAGGTDQQWLLTAVRVNEPSATSIRKLRKQATTPSPVAGYRVVIEE